MKKIFILLLTLFTLTACGNKDTKPNPDLDVITHTVTFDSNGGSSINSIKVEDGKTISKPKDPIKENHLFGEWQLNTNTYDFSAIVTKDITLKATWTDNSELKKALDIINYTTNYESISEMDLGGGYTGFPEGTMYYVEITKFDNNKYYEAMGIKSCILEDENGHYVLDEHGNYMLDLDANDNPIYTTTITNERYVVNNGNNTYDVYETYYGEVTFEPNVEDDDLDDLFKPNDLILKVSDFTFEQDLYVAEIIESNIDTIFGITIDLSNGIDNMIVTQDVYAPIGFINITVNNFNKTSITLPIV